jgi:hypothetical protein
MNARYQDAMAIVCTHGKPNLFITMMMNPNHLNILAALLSRQTPSDRPDIVSRVFKAMLDTMIQDIKNGIFGKIVTLFVYLVKYQARGLLHAHIVAFLAPCYKFNTSDDINCVVCAKIPQDTVLGDLVIRFMCHGPCGITNPAAQCMVQGECYRHYPKQLSQETMWTGTMNQPVYR